MTLIDDIGLLYMPSLDPSSTIIVSSTCEALKHVLLVQFKRYVDIDSKTEVLTWGIFKEGGALLCLLSGNGHHT